MKNTINLFLLFLLFFSFPSFSWEEDLIKKVQVFEEKLLDKQIKIKEKVEESLKLKSEMFNGLEEKLEKFMDSVGSKFFDHFFEDDFFKDDFFKDMDLLGGLNRSSFGEWKETDDEVIFILIAETKKGLPLNINIKDGILKIDGDLIQKKEEIDKKGNKKIVSQRIVRMRQSYSIPEGVDEANPVIKEESGKIKIIFKKLKNYKQKKKRLLKKPIQKFRPIDPGLFDKTI